MGILIYFPMVVYAKEICYVNENSSDNGDGSKDDPYDKIYKAIESNCNKIKIKDGYYKESFTLRKSMTLEGNNSDKVVIEGKIIMKDDSEISELTVDVGGIIVASSSSVNIGNLKIKNAVAGIDILEGGKLKIKDSTITLNRKGMYVRKGSKIEISDCNVHENNEEGIDIRANVKGKIVGNKIYENDESGIELVLGKTELIISKNIIKRNSSSGIALQYYTDFNSLGDVKIKQNTIKDNSNYGIDCKSPSGGKNKPKGYWKQSTELSSNEIVDNKKKEFASACKFAKSYEEINTEIKILEKKESKKQINETEREELENLKKEKGENARIDLENQKERDTKKYIDNVYVELDNLYQGDEVLKKQTLTRSFMWSFVVGPNYKNLKDISDHLEVYDEKIDEVNEKSMEILNKERLNDINKQLDMMKEKKKIMNSFIEKERNNFSILGWILKKIYFS